MAIINFDTNETLTSMLVKVAQATNNNILDVGYLCSDCHPYFKFSASGKSDVYTPYHPDNVTSNTSVPVYQLTSIQKDGKSYQAMAFLGNGTQNGASLTYDGTTYTCTNKAFVNIRGFYINKWSLRKPTLAKGSDNITDWNNRYLGNDRRIGDYLWGLEVPVYTHMTWQDIEGAQYAYVGLPNPDCTPVDGEQPWARLRDFEGYNPDAKCTLTAVMPDKTNSLTNILMLSILQSEDSSAVSFDAMAKANTSFDVGVGDLYPAVIVKEVGTNARYMQLLYPAAADGTPGITPTKLGNTFGASAWSANLDSLVNEHKIDNTKDFYACVVLVNKYQNLLNLDDGYLNILSWRGVNNAEPNSMQFGQLIPLPDGIMQRVMFSSNYPLYTVTYANGTWNEVTALNLFFNYKGETTEGFDYYCVIEAQGKTVMIEKKMISLLGQFTIRVTFQELGFQYNANQMFYYTVYASNGTQGRNLIARTSVNFISSNGGPVLG